MNRIAILLALTTGCLDRAPITDEPTGEPTSETEQALNGDTWTTVDDNPYAGGTGATTSGIAISPISHRILIAGARGETNATTTWVVRGSADGVNWGLNSTFKYIATGSSAALGAAVDSLGFFYVVGTARDADDRYHWVVRKSEDDGQTWTTVFQPYGYAATDLPTGISVDAIGNVFVTGSIMQNGRNIGVIYRGQKHGVTWTGVFSHAGAGVENSFNGTCIAPYGSQTATYAVGWESANATSTYATFYYSLDQGTTWNPTTQIGSQPYTHAYTCAAAGAYTDVAIGTWKTSPVASNWLATIWDFSTLNQLYGYSLTGATSLFNRALATTHANTRSYFAGQLASAATASLQWQTVYHTDTAGNVFSASDVYVYPGSTRDAKPVTAAFRFDPGLVRGRLGDRCGRSVARYRSPSSVVSRMPIMSRDVVRGCKAR